MSRCWFSRLFVVRCVLLRCCFCLGFVDCAVASVVCLRLFVLFVVCICMFAVYVLAYSF